VDAALEQVHDEVRARLSAVDQLYTSGRRRLVELLAGVDRPVTIPELVAGRRVVALSSAYRNLGVLEQVGAVTRIHGSSEHARFELAEGVVGEHHHHLICQSCGRVDDFTVPPQVERTIERALTEVATGSAFVASSHRLDLVGTCGDCATA
jgi:Fur family ferric uptake transcriptional regulator